MSKRRSIVLSNPQDEFLETEATRLGISVADLIRRYLDRVIDDERTRATGWRARIK